MGLPIARAQSHVPTPAVSSHPPIFSCAAGPTGEASQATRLSPPVVPFGEASRDFVLEGCVRAGVDGLAPSAFRGIRARVVWHILSRDCIAMAVALFLCLACYRQPQPVQDVNNWNGTEDQVPGQVPRRWPPYRRLSLSNRRFQLKSPQISCDFVMIQKEGRTEKGRSGKQN
jgi:hypothetical protein